MNKFKFDIQKNNLSWEKTNYKKCDSPKCNEKGAVSYTHLRAHET